MIEKNKNPTQYSIKQVTERSKTISLDERGVIPPAGKFHGMDAIFGKIELNSIYTLSGLSNNGKAL